jgi:sugar lactone lactonase YvrE
VALILLFGLGPAPARAETTKQWQQSLFEDFEQGRAEMVSLRSDGTLLLAPSFREIYDAPSSYLWALAADSKGNLYAAGGPDAKVFRIGADGTKSTFFETAAVEIHALAIDAADNVYAATSPEAKIYRIEPSGAHRLFFDPGENYIWDMAFDSKGNLLVATGDGGKVYRVTPAGDGKLFFDTEETHVRSIAVDSSDNLILGTDPSGLILRVSVKQGGEPGGFVLHQTSKKEVTAVILAADGTIYAAGVGTRSAVQPPPQSMTTSSGEEPPPASVTANLVPGSPQGAQAQSPQPPAPSGLATRVAGGSDIYRIAPDGEPAVLWRSRDDIVYALGFDNQGRLLLGTGDHGRLIRLDSEHVHSIVLTTASRQITALGAGPKGQVYTAASNIGKVFELGPGLETEGSFESKPFDAGIFSEWGRLEWIGSASGQAKIAVSTRSGNLDSPARNWSEWSAPVMSAEGGEAGAPAARFVQWRAVLSAAAGGESPALDSVTVYYRPKNIAPVVTEIEATPPNYRFADKPQTPTVKNLTLAPLGASSRRSASVSAKQGHTLLPSQGHVGVRWDASDDNDDTLVFQLEIRAEDERNWKLLEDEIEDSYLSWDSTSFADGLYRVRVTASDAPSNPAAQAKTHSRISEPFRIDNTAPGINGLSCTMQQGKLRVRFSASDTATPIQAAEYSLDGGEWKRTLPTSALFDSRELPFDFEMDAPEAGEHTVAVRVYDSHENVATAKAVVR